jgi:hypothetical protein
MTNGNAYCCAQCGAVEAAPQVEGGINCGWLRFQPIAASASIGAPSRSIYRHFIGPTVLCSGECALDYLKKLAGQD